MIYLTGYPWIIDISEDMLGGYLYDQPGDLVLDSPWGDKMDVMI